MGQTLGRAPLPPGCNRFINCKFKITFKPHFRLHLSFHVVLLSCIFTVPRSCIYDLWEAFNDIAEGFGLTVEEFQEIIKSSLLEYLSVTERQLNADADAVFRLFDDDEVGFTWCFSITLQEKDCLFQCIL